MADAKKLEEERQRFLKSILSRGPHKRQIKPAENNPLLQFALGEESEDDSEEDEDFEVHEDSDSSSDDNEEEEVDRRGPVAFVSGRQISEDIDSSSDSEMEVDAHSGPLTVGALIEAMKKKPPLIGHASSVASSEGPDSSMKMDILICGVCLDDVSDEGDEIVECDNCGMTVHEGCYGINDEDNDSGKSSDTDSPTEAWFCDSCRASEKQPDCELCPNLGGIFKETDSGQWVHLLCALYTPGVAFVKPETLESVTLSELTPYRWGTKDCCLCEDERFSRTGVCVSCDAGMCKTYFHITCAQMHGLLSDVPEECEEDVADPLYAHCKLHADKKSTASRRRAWMAYQSRYKKREERVSVEENNRLKTLLQEARRQFQEQKKKYNVKPYTPTEKVPHLLSSCPGACRQLFKKAELLGFATKQNHGVVNVRRKWFVPPALTCEFVNYYHDRDHRLTEMGEHQELLQSNSKLFHEEEQKLRLQYDTLNDDMQGFSGSVNLFREECRLLHCVLCELGAQEFPVPDVLEVKETKPATSDSPAEAIEIRKCFTCKKTDNQHLMVDCDTCRNYYHLACVDPPLTRMPKKSAKCLWQCSECDSSEGESEMDVDVSDNTPISQSRHRRTIKEPTKFTPEILELSKKIKRKRKSGDGPSEPDVVKKKTKVEPKQTSKSPRKYVRIEKVVDNRSQCSHCKKPGENSTLVRCDNCKLCYHFKCLDPPLKSNPKKRGYMWYCTDCDESEEDSEEEEAMNEVANTSLEGAGDTEKENTVKEEGDDAEKEKSKQGKEEKEEIKEKSYDADNEKSKQGKREEEVKEKEEGIESSHDEKSTREREEKSTRGKEQEEQTKEKPNAGNEKSKQVKKEEGKVTSTQGKEEEREESSCKEKNKTDNETGDYAGIEKSKQVKEEEEGKEKSTQGKKEEREESSCKEKNTTDNETGDDARNEKSEQVKKEDEGKEKSTQRNKEEREESSCKEKNKADNVTGDDAGNAKSEQVKKEEEGKDSTFKEKKTVKEGNDADNVTEGKDGRKGEANTNDGKAEKAKKKKVDKEDDNKEGKDEERGGGKGKKVDGKNKEEGKEGKTREKEEDKRKGKVDKGEGTKKEEEQRNKKETTREEGKKKKRKTDEEKRSTKEEQHKKVKMEDEEVETESEGSTKDMDKKAEKEKGQEETGKKKKETSYKAKGKKKKTCQEGDTKEQGKHKTEEKPKEKRDNAKKSK